ncbi:hypothetical protein [Spirulina subsalsa]|uniref:hypothetical protein n=1 Tax=Spirulina subsalsa TaxID=54311 RepID=UPI0003094DA7|nr:hypothetical protein [Spirulina subsalsa]
MKRTVSVPVDLPGERFLPLMGFCAEIFNQHIDWALKRYLHNRKTLQQKGTRSAKRRLKAMSGREKWFMGDVNHCVTKKLANFRDVILASL